MGNSSPQSESSKSALFNGLVSQEMNDIGQYIGQAAFDVAVGEVGGTLLGKAIEWGVGKMASKAISEGYSSFNAFKKAQGPAGKGLAWHHIVEQNASNVSSFRAEKIHNINNVIKLPHGKESIHAKISGYYSSKPKFTGGLTIREWLSTKKYVEQYKFGIKVLEQRGWKP